MIKEAFNKLRKYVEKERFIGYDPYDTLTSPIPFKLIGKWGPILAIQFQKRNPFNIRPLLGIKKDINPKAFGLFLESYSRLYRHEPKDEYKKKADYFFNWLTSNYTKGYSGYCWGYNFDWASPVKYLKAHSPTIVVSGFIAKGIFEYWQTFKDEKSVEILKSIGEFAKHDLPFTITDNELCVSYSTEVKDCCYNASLLAGELYAKLYFITKDPDYKEKAMEIADFVVHHQHVNGSWYYSIDIESGNERKQIDFHQGYVISSLNEIVKYCELTDRKYTNAIDKGLNYYKTQQFLASGQSLWRIPKKWPVDIHNQSQGIISLLDLNDKEFAEKIANWTISNMQASDGHFYYKKYPAHSIKTSYMRWSQAWMFLALTRILTNK